MPLKSRGLLLAVLLCGGLCGCVVEKHVQDSASVATIALVDDCGMVVAGGRGYLTTDRCAPGLPEYESHDLGFPVTGYAPSAAGGAWVSSQTKVPPATRDGLSSAKMALYRLDANDHVVGRVEVATPNTWNFLYDEFETQDKTLIALQGGYLITSYTDGEDAIYSYEHTELAVACIREGKGGKLSMTRTVLAGGVPVRARLQKGGDRYWVIGTYLSPHEDADIVYGTPYFAEISADGQLVEEHHFSEAPRSHFEGGFTEIYGGAPVLLSSNYDFETRESFRWLHRLSGDSLQKIRLETEEQVLLAQPALLGGYVALVTLWESGDAFALQMFDADGKKTGQRYLIPASFNYQVADGSDVYVLFATGLWEMKQLDSDTWQLGGAVTRLSASASRYPLTTTLNRSMLLVRSYSGGPAIQYFGDTLQQHSEELVFLGDN